MVARALVVGYLAPGRSPAVCAACRLRDALEQAQHPFGHERGSLLVIVGEAVIDYVANLMKAAGYNVTIQTYHFDYFSFVGPPQFSEVSPTPHDYALNSEWDPARSSGTPANARVQPAAGIVDPPDPNGSTSTSGCSSSDFTGFTAGNIALIQRGACTFATKVTNATNAGASGVIIFNEGNPGRTGVVNGSIGFIPNIPVAFPELRHRDPRSGSAGLLRPDRLNDVPGQRLWAVSGLKGSVDPVFQLNRAQPHPVLAGGNGRVQLQHGRNPGQRHADRSGLLQDAG